MNKLQQISAERFTYENWGSDFWNMLGLGYAESMEEDNLIRAIKEYGIGYCSSDRLQIRPKDDKYVAVMCERDGEKFWFHVFTEDISDLINNPKD